MINPIEKLIVSRHLPDPTPNLDRRIQQLTFESLTARKVTQKQSVGALILVGGSLAVCLSGLIFLPSEKMGSLLPYKDRTPETSMVHSLDVDIPSLNLNSDNLTDDREWLFTPGTIVVSTSFKEGELK